MTTRSLERFSTPRAAASRQALRRAKRRRGRFALTFAAILIACAFVSWRARNASAAPELEVHGRGHFEARTTRSSGSIAVSGSLLDDADRAIAGADVVVTFVAEDGTHLEGAPCRLGALPSVAPDGTARPTVTDAAGTFCVRAGVRPGTTRVSLTWPGTKFLAGATEQLSVDASRNAVTLAFDPEPREIMMDESPHGFDVVAVVSSDGDEVAASGLHLRLSDERGALLGEATTAPNGRARILVPSAALFGPAGPSELRLMFDGDAKTAPAQHFVAVERREEVHVGALPKDVFDGFVSAVEEQDGAGFDVAVRGASGGPIASGSVEALLDGTVIGLGEVSNGVAHLTTRWSEAATARLEVRYVPALPWYVPGPPATLSVSFQGMSVRQRSLVVLAGVLIMASFVVSRSRSRATVRAPRSPGPPLPSDSQGSPRVDLVGVHRDGRTDWEGRVVDAHDRVGIGGVRLTLERGGFDASEVLASATTDEAGHFRLPGLRVVPTDRIIAEGPLHGNFSRPAPPPGILEIALVSRRRALLQRLIHWARQRGAPFDAKPEATPAHVQRMAVDDPGTARWAGAVEAAAFGNRPVDAEVEAEVDRLGHQGGEGSRRVPAG